MTKEDSNTHLVSKASKGFPYTRELRIVPLAGNVLSSLNRDSASAKCFRLGMEQEGRQSGLQAEETKNAHRDTSGCIDF